MPRPEHDPPESTNPNTAHADARSGARRFRHVAPISTPLPRPLYAHAHVAIPILSVRFDLSTIRNTTSPSTPTPKRVLTHFFLAKRLSFGLACIINLMLLVSSTYEVDNTMEQTIDSPPAGQQYRTMSPMNAESHNLCS